MIVNSSFRTRTFVADKVLTPTDDAFVECILQKRSGIRRTKKPFEISFVLREEQDRIVGRRPRTRYEEDSPERRVLSFQGVKVQAANAWFGAVIPSTRPHDHTLRNHRVGNR